MIIRTKKPTSRVIPLSSMADIAFLLLIFFIVTMSIQEKKLEKISFPLIKTEEKIDSHNSFVLIFGKQGIVRYQGKRIIPSSLKTIVKQRKNTKQQISKVRFSGDKNCPYQTVALYIDVLKTLGVKIVIFTAKRQDAER